MDVPLCFFWGFWNCLAVLPILPNLANLPRYGYLNYLCRKLLTIRNLNCSIIRTPDVGYIFKYDQNWPITRVTPCTRLNILGKISVLAKISEIPITKQLDNLNVWHYDFKIEISLEWTVHSHMEPMTDMSNCSFFNPKLFLFKAINTCHLQVWTCTSEICTQFIYFGQITIVHFVLHFSQAWIKSN